MTISKIDLLNKRLGRCMRGYCPEEVDLLIHEVAEALGEAADENRRLLERLAELDRAMQAAAGERSPSAQALAAGRRIVEELQEGARREARQVVEDARAQAERILTDANLLKVKVLEETAGLRAQKAALEKALRDVIEAHFRLLESASPAEYAQDESRDFIFAEGLGDMRGGGQSGGQGRGT
ncbi:hypothetical protein JCM15519_05360 [Fundidesulfovibrio butyratiphilus]